MPQYRFDTHSGTLQSTHVEIQKDLPKPGVPVKCNKKNPLWLRLSTFHSNPGHACMTHVWRKRLIVTEKQLAFGKIMGYTRYVDRECEFRYCVCIRRRGGKRC